MIFAKCDETRPVGHSKQLVGTQEQDGKLKLDWLNRVVCAISLNINNTGLKKI